jgi:Ca-activated chloride channel family protein
VSFDYPLLLWTIPAVALATAGLAWWARAVKVQRAGRWSPELAQRARHIGRRGPIVIGLAGALATAALAGPRWGSRVVQTETKGLNLVLVVDISRSMLAEDMSPSRLEYAKRHARRLVHDLSGDRVGLVAFAGQSFILSPLTIDAGALDMLLEALDPDLTSAGGTDLGSALEQARGVALAGDLVADRVIVIFTDGEAHDSLPAAVDVAERLERDGIELVLVAVGGTEPVPIPIRDLDGSFVGHQQDPDGNVVQTARRDEVLNAVADAARGIVVTAGHPDAAGAVREAVAGLKRSQRALTTAAQEVSRAWIPLLGAVLLLTGHAFTRRSKALVGLMLACLGSSKLAAQGRASAADHAWQRGDLRGAAEAYLERVRGGSGGDTAWYNLGTAALAIGDTGTARQALERAARSIEPALRFRALYNLGLLHLRAGLAADTPDAERLAQARRAYREALLLAPGDSASKRNLELAVRHTPPPTGTGAPPPPATGDDPSSASEDEGLSESQAEQILNSMAEEERRTLAERTQRQRAAAAVRGRKEW